MAGGTGGTQLAVTLKTISVRNGERRSGVRRADEPRSEAELAERVERNAAARQHDERRRLASQLTLARKPTCAAEIRSSRLPLLIDLAEISSFALPANRV